MSRTETEALESGGLKDLTLNSDWLEIGVVPKGPFWRPTNQRRALPRGPEAGERLWIEVPPPQQVEGWRCFHCDEILPDREAAALHFGNYEDCTPACRIGVERFREMEGQLASYRNETDLDARTFYTLGAEHSVKLRREEERGYARGLEDAPQMFAGDAPPGHWTPDDGWAAHPQSAEEWDPQKDPVGEGLNRSMGRLGFARDLDDPRLPPGKAVVNRLDLSRAMSQVQRVVGLLLVLEDKRRRIARLEEAVSKALAAFLKYAANHEAKGTPESSLKAQVNHELAGVMRNALGE